MQEERYNFSFSSGLASL